MSRPAKPHQSINIKLDKALAEKLAEVSKETRLTKTSVIERAMEKYFREYDEKGKI